MNIDGIENPFTKEDEGKLAKNDNWLRKTVESVMNSDPLTTVAIAISVATQLKKEVDDLYSFLTDAVGKPEAKKNKTLTILAQAAAISTWFSIACQQGKIDTKCIVLPSPKEPMK